MTTDVLLVAAAVSYASGVGAMTLACLLLLRAYDRPDEANENFPHTLFPPPAL